MRNSNSLAGVRLASLVALIAIVVTTLDGCDSTSGPEPEAIPTVAPELFASARYDQVRFKQLHNSYQRRVDIETQLSWNESDPSNCGSSCLEIDLRIDPQNYLVGVWDWSVSHVHFEPGSANRLASYLRRLEAWSDANPGHRVVTVQIDMKDTPGDHIFQIGGGSELYLASMPDSLDAYIARHFDTDRLYTPADMIDPPKDLVQSAIAGGWPTLAELRGKFVFALSMNATDTSAYCGTTPGDRLCFAIAWYARAFDGESVITSGDRIFFYRNIRDGDGWQEKTRRMKAQGGLIMRGDNVCQDADEDGDPDCQRHPTDVDERWDSLELWSMAMSAGFQIIATDLVDEEDWAMVGTCPQWEIPDAFWGYEREPIPSAHTRSAPAATSYRGSIYAFLDGSGGVEFVSWNGSSWSGPYDVPGDPEGVPGATAHADVLHLVAWNESGGALLWQRFDGADWSSGETLGEASGAAALVSFGNLLYAVYPGPDGKLTAQSWDGAVWSAPVSVGTQSLSALAATVLDGQIRVVWAAEDGRMSQTSFDGSVWSASLDLTRLNGARTLHAPAVVTVDDHVEVAIRALDHNYPQADTHITCFSVWASGDVTGQSMVFGSKTSAGVALAVRGSQPLMILKAQGDETVWVQYQSVW